MALVQTVPDEVTTLEHWSEALLDLHARIAHRFRRVEVRERVRRYLAGLLTPVERKNGWQLAEASGETEPHGVQRLLNEATWDADGVRDDLRASVVEHLGDVASGVLTVDETSFLKKGTRSCGVARQYCGTLGTTANAHLGVFLAYASDKGTTFIDRALYLPRAWTRDRERRLAAGVPKGTRFATKTTLAKRMLARAFAAAVPARWVVADSFYGRSHMIRQWLEQQGRSYVLMLPTTTAVEYQGARERAEQLGARVPEEAWSSLSAEAPGRHQWACLTLTSVGGRGMGRWLLVRRTVADPSELAYSVAYGPTRSAPEELVRVADVRWRIEEGFAQLKGELGLAQYEGAPLGRLAPLHDPVPARACLPRRCGLASATARRGACRGAPPAHCARGPTSRAGARWCSGAAGIPVEVVEMAPEASGGCGTEPRQVTWKLSRTACCGEDERCGGGAECRAG